MSNNLEKLIEDTLALTAKSMFMAGYEAACAAHGLPTLTADESKHVEQVLAAVLKRHFGEHNRKGNGQ